MEKLIPFIIKNDAESEHLALALNHILEDDFSRIVFPQIVDEESLEDSIGTPLFVLFRNICQTNEEDLAESPLMSLMCDLSSHQNCIGYLMLYYIKVSKAQDSYFAYQEYIKCNMKEEDDEEDDFSSNLLSDLKHCQVDDVNMLCYILPDIFREFEKEVISDSDFIHLAVSSIDAAQLQELICFILRGEIKLLKKDVVVSLISKF